MCIYTYTILTYAHVLFAILLVGYHKPVHLFGSINGVDSPGRADMGVGLPP